MGFVEPDPEEEEEKQRRQRRRKKRFDVSAVQVICNDDQMTGKVPRMTHGHEMFCSGSRGRGFEPQPGQPQGV